MLNVSEHAKQRALERFGFGLDKVSDKLNSLIKNSVEVFCNGQGRAFENKQHGIVFITDIAKSNIITVYHAKGTEIKLSSQKNIVEMNQYGTLKNKEMRLMVLENFEKLIKKYEFKDSNLNIEISKNSLKIEKIKLKLFKIKDCETFDFNVEIINTIKAENKEKQNERKLNTKRKNELINEVSEILGFDLHVTSEIEKILRDHLK